MTERWVVAADQVWKRYCRTLRRGVRYAMSDSLRAFAGLAPGSRELRADEFWSLRNVSFQLAPGEGMALVGTNGAGKSTMLKILSGVFAPDRGELRVRGRLVSLMMAGAGFHPVLSGRENIHIFGSMLGMRRREIMRRIPAILEFAELSEFIDTPVKYYSTGMYMRLAFSVAAQSEPDVLIIDEVLAVGDLAFREKCIDHLLRMKRDGCALLLVSHSAGQLRRLADHGLWLARGESVAQGPIEGVLDGYLAELEAATAARQAVAPAPVTTRVPSEIQGAAIGAAAIELLPRDAVDIELRAHTTAQLEFAVRFEALCPEPIVTIALAREDGVAVAAASLALATATWPPARAGTRFTFAFGLTPRLAALRGTLALTVSTIGADGGERQVVARRWPCRVIGDEGGANEAGRGGLDLRAVFTARAGDGPAAAGAVDWQAPAVVDPGVPVAIAVTSGDRPTAWLLQDASGTTLVRLPLALLPAAAPPVVAVCGRFFANLAPGRYGQALQTDAGVVAGPDLEVTGLAETIGHVDLDARGHVVVAADGDGATDGDAADAGIRLVEIQIDGSADALDDLLGQRPRVVSHGNGRSAGSTALATGERCRARVRIRAAPGLRDWDIAIGFAHPERGRCAGMRLRRAAIGAATGQFDVHFEFAAHLARGEYVLSCSVAALDAGGNRVEAHAPDFVRCFVLGPDETGSDCSLEIAALREVELDGESAVLPELAAEARDVAGTGPRLLAFDIGLAVKGEPTVIRAGELATAQIDVLTADAIAAPSFKFAFVNHGKRCVARMAGFERQHPLQPLAAGVPRRYLMQFTPHLVGGRYEVQIALQHRSGQRVTVTDRRHHAAVCLVPAKMHAHGPGWLDATVVVDVQPVASE